MYYCVEGGVHIVTISTKKEKKRKKKTENLFFEIKWKCQNYELKIK